MRLRDPYKASRRASLLGLLAVVATFLFWMGWLVLGMSSRSFTSDENSSGTVPGLTGNASIVRDRYGVPYITAENENDAMAALGYAHAQDRLWQMDMLRRFGQGRLSELLGPRMIAFDAYAKTIGIESIAEEIVAKMPKETKAAVEAYSRGVTAFIEQNRSRFPLEFDALGYEPEDWTPVHSVIVLRLHAWEQNSAFWTDLVYEGLRERIDSLRFSEIAPWYPSYAPTIIPGGQRPEPQLEAYRSRTGSSAPVVDSTMFDSTATDSTSARTDSSDRRQSGLLHGFERLISLDMAIRDALGMGGSSVGSNAWAISGDRTAHGAPLLANDTHLEHSAPCKWYQAVLFIGDRRLAGVTIPGMPFIVAGRNNDVSWGITSLRADESDFYLERLDPAGKDRVLHDGTWEPLEIRRDSIIAKDTAATMLTIRSSRHGPLISDLERLLEMYPVPGIDSVAAAAMGRQPSDSTALAVRWLGRDVSQELTALQRINRASNFSQFRKGLEFGGIPGLSFVYADRKGTIGYVPCFRAPVRNSADPNRVNPGWDSKYNWRGSHDVSDLPTLEQPEQGFIASANNKPTNSLPFNIGDLWDDPSRAMRLDDYLSQGNSFEVIDCSQLHVDVISEHMLYMVEFLLRSFPDSAAQGAKVREALAFLRNWNGEMSAESPEATIAAEWTQRVYHRTWSDEMGPVLYRHFMMNAQLPLKSIRRQLMTDSRWFDDISTPKLEVRDDILRNALGEALDSLHVRFDSWDLASWTFGRIHTVTYPHRFSIMEPMRDVVNIGPYEAGGSATTLNTGEWSFNDPYAVKLGPSMRQIVDFADTTILLRSVLTTGQSGQPMNDHYQDQTIIFQFGGYVSLYAHLPPEQEIQSVTELEPK